MNGGNEKRRVRFVGLSSGNSATESIHSSTINSDGAAAASGGNAHSLATSANSSASGADARGEVVAVGRYTQEELAQMHERTRTRKGYLKQGSMFIHRDDIPPTPPPLTRQQRAERNAARVPPPVNHRPWETVKKWFKPVKQLASGFDKTFSSARFVDGSMIGVSVSHCAEKPEETLERQDRCRSEISMAVDLHQRGFEQSLVKSLGCTTKLTRNGPQTYHLQELAPYGSLRSYLARKTRENGGELEFGVVKPLLRSACLAFGDLTVNNVIHRDIKSDNTVVMSPTTAKACDLGFATETTPCWEDLGTTAFKAPELLSRFRYYAAASQVFSFGQLVLEACTGRPPYNSEFNSARMDAIESWAAKQSGSSALSDVSQYRLTDAPCESDAMDYARDTIDRLTLSAVPSRSYTELKSSRRYRHLRGFATVVEQCQPYFEAERASFFEVLHNPMFYSGERLDVTDFQVGQREASLSFDIYPEKNLRQRHPIASHTVRFPVNRRFDIIDEFAEMLVDERKNWSKELEAEFNQAVARSFSTVKSISKRRARKVLRDQRIVDELLQNLQQLKDESIITEEVADAVQAEYDQDHADYEVPSDVEDLQSSDESEEQEEDGDADQKEEDRESGDNDDDSDDGSGGPPPAGGAAGPRGGGGGGGGRDRGPPPRGDGPSGDDDAGGQGGRRRQPRRGAAEGTRKNASGFAGAIDPDAASVAVDDAELRFRLSRPSQLLGLAHALMESKEFALVVEEAIVLLGAGRLSLDVPPIRFSPRGTDALPSPQTRDFVSTSKDAAGWMSKAVPSNAAVPMNKHADIPKLVLDVQSPLTCVSSPMPADLTSNTLSVESADTTNSIPATVAASTKPTSWQERLLAHNKGHEAVPQNDADEYKNETQGQSRWLKLKKTFFGSKPNGQQNSQVKLEDSSWNQENGLLPRVDGASIFVPKKTRSTSVPSVPVDVSRNSYKDSSAISAVPKANPETAIDAISPKPNNGKSPLHIFSDGQEHSDISKSLPHKPVLNVDEEVKNIRISNLLAKREPVVAINSNHFEELSVDSLFLKAFLAFTPTPESTDSIPDILETDFTRPHATAPTSINGNLSNQKAPKASSKPNKKAEFSSHSFSEGQLYSETSNYPDPSAGNQPSIAGALLPTHLGATVSVSDAGLRPSSSIAHNSRNVSNSRNAAVHFAEPGKQRPSSFTNADPLADFLAAKGIQNSAGTAAALRNVLSDSVAATAKRKGISETQALIDLADGRLKMKEARSRGKFIAKKQSIDPPNAPAPPLVHVSESKSSHDVYRISQPKPTVPSRPAANRPGQNPAVIPEKAMYSGASTRGALAGQSQSAPSVKSNGSASLKSVSAKPVKRTGARIASASAKSGKQAQPINLFGRQPSGIYGLSVNPFSFSHVKKTNRSLACSMSNLGAPRQRSVHRMGASTSIFSNHSSHGSSLFSTGSRSFLGSSSNYSTASQHRNSSLLGASLGRSGNAMALTGRNSSSIGNSSRDSGFASMNRSRSMLSSTMNRSSMLCSRY